MPDAPTDADPGTAPTAAVIVPLEPKKHDRAAFSCGEPSLDRYLQRQAAQNIRRRAAAVYVLTPSEASAVIMGYYTLSAASVHLTDLSPETRKRLARYPEVGAVLLGRLAVDTRFAGRGWGAYLLRNALLRSLEQSHELGITVVIVDALDDAARQFYERYGFVALPGHERRLVLPLATVAKAVE